MSLPEQCVVRAFETSDARCRFLMHSVVQSHRAGNCGSLQSPWKGARRWQQAAVPGNGCQGEGGSSRGRRSSLAAAYGRWQLLRGPSPLSLIPSGSLQPLVSEVTRTPVPLHRRRHPCIVSGLSACTLGRARASADSVCQLRSVASAAPGDLLTRASVVWVPQHGERPSLVVTSADRC